MAGRKKSSTAEKKPEKVSPKVYGIKKVRMPTSKNAPKIDEGLREQFLAEHEDDASVKRKPRKGGVYECACCGNPITENNGVYQPRKVYLNGYHPVCLTCQQKHYATMAQETSRTYALFYACAAYNVPYKPSLMEDMAANQNGVWYEYVKKLERGYTPDAKNDCETWTDGITDIAEAFGGEFPVLPITGDVVVANMGEMNDRDRWNIEWGENMSDEDCRNADDRYMMMTANRSGGTIPANVSMYIRDAIRYMIARDKQKDSMEAKRYQEMADKIMNSDSVKNWQSNKGETIQVDRVVRYLESIGAMSNGYLVGYDDLVKILSAQHGNYSTSLDVVDCMMMCIINTMRKNMGEAELTKLPLSAQVEDKKGELLPEMSEDERKILEGLGMKPPERERVI